MYAYTDSIPHAEQRLQWQIVTFSVGSCRSEVAARLVKDPRSARPAADGWQRQKGMVQAIQQWMSEGRDRQYRKLGEGPTPYLGKGGCCGVIRQSVLQNVGVPLPNGDNMSGFGDGAKSAHDDALSPMLSTEASADRPLPLPVYRKLRGAWAYWRGPAR